MTKPLRYATPKLGGYVVLTALWWSPGGTAASVRAQALSALGGVANWHQLWAHRPYAAGSSCHGVSRP